MKDTKSFIRKRFNLRKDYDLISAPTIQLSPQEADRFITCIVDESTWKNYARVEKMSQQQKKIRHLGFGEGKFFYPAGEFDESKYKKQWSHNRITLQTQEIRGAVAIFDSDLEDLPPGISPDEFNDTTIKKIIAPKIANELEYAFWMADTHSYNSWCAEDIESLWDGWRYIITHAQASGDAYYNDVCGGSHVKNACLCESGAYCESACEHPEGEFEICGKIAEVQQAEPYNLEIKYGKMIKNLPPKYKKQGFGELTFLNHDLVTEDYLQALETRGTPLGDRIITEGGVAKYHGIPIINVPLYPTDLGSDGGSPDVYGNLGGGEYTDSYLTPKNNLIVGIQKAITIEPYRSPADRATYWFYTMRVTVAVENVNAIVIVVCLEHAC